MCRFLERCNAPELLKNSIAPYVTCDGFLERCNVKIQEQHM